MTNEDSLASNKELASDLIANFRGIRDFQENPSHCFFNKIIVPDAEFPELHFTLEGDIADDTVLINFWRDSICFELGTAQDPSKLFQSLQLHSEKIMSYGFLIEDPQNDDLLNLNEGIAANFKEYLSWSGMVERVVDITNGSRGGLRSV